jgi:hypothetical protein
MSVNEKMTLIANKIRSYTGDTDPLTLDEMPDAIQLGWFEGRREAAETAYNEGIEQGKKSQYDEFWDCYCLEKRRIFDYAFHQADFLRTSRGFNPPQPIKPTNAVNMFSDARGITKLTKEHIDFSICTTANYCFAWCADLVEIEEIHLPSSNMYMFAELYILEKIGKLIIPESTTVINDNHPFVNACKLTHITIEGVIPQTISFQWSSLLTHESLMSIINALKDYSGTTSTYTLTLHADAKARLTDAEKAIITQKGWTLA